MEKLLQNIFFASCLLLIAGTVEAQAQSNATELQAYLQQLEVDKVQHKNNPARYQEYENKIASIKAELRTMGVDELPTQTVTDEQPTETEQARMVRTLSADEYAKWKMANAPLAKIENKNGPMAKTANAVIEQKQDLEAANPQKFAHKHKSNNVAKMPYSVEQKQANIMRVEEAMKKAQNEHNAKLVLYYEQLLLNLKK